MTTENTIPEFSFRKPAVYKIIVQGVMDGSWSERLGGLQINVYQAKDKDPTTELIGQINDQAALLGVLNTLYDFQHTIISVNMLKDEQ
ncbi:MAG: hypothetical protein KAQ62_19910 [Cyclobacteriaceae bacterium]|nr:hypothetical protein [Cyclobacteriaceae bacterium]